MKKNFYTKLNKNQLLLKFLVYSIVMLSNYSSIALADILPKNVGNYNKQEKLFAASHSMPHSGSGVSSYYKNLTRMFGINSANTNLDPLYPLPNSIKNHFNLRDSEYFIVNIFASWCENCVNEVKKLKQIAKDHNINMYGIAISDSEKFLKKMLGENFYPYKEISLNFPMSELKKLQINKIPRFFIVYKNNIVYDIEGNINESILNNEIYPVLEAIQKK